MDKLLEVIPKSILPFLGIVCIMLIGWMARETMKEVKGMSVQLATLQTQLSIVQATMVTRTEVVTIVREEMDREARKHE